MENSELATKNTRKSLREILDDLNSRHPVEKVSRIVEEGTTGLELDRYDSKHEDGKPDYTTSISENIFPNNNASKNTGYLFFKALPLMDNQIAAKSIMKEICNLVQNCTAINTDENSGEEYKKLSETVTNRFGHLISSLENPPDPVVFASNEEKNVLEKKVELAEIGFDDFDLAKLGKTNYQINAHEIQKTAICEMPDNLYDFLISLPSTEIALLLANDFASMGVRLCEQPEIFKDPNELKNVMGKLHEAQILNVMNDNFDHTLNISKHLPVMNSIAWAKEAPENARAAKALVEQYMSTCPTEKSHKAMQAWVSIFEGNEAIQKEAEAITNRYSPDKNDPNNTILNLSNYGLTNHLFKLSAYPTVPSHVPWYGEEVIAPIPLEFRKPQIKGVDLSRNHFTKIEEDWFNLPKDWTVYLGENPLGKDAVEQANERSKQQGGPSFTIADRQKLLEAPSHQERELTSSTLTNSGLGGKKAYVTFYQQEKGGDRWKLSLNMLNENAKNDQSSPSISSSSSSVTYILNPEILQKGTHATLLKHKNSGKELKFKISQNKKNQQSQLEASRESVVKATIRNFYRNK